MLSPAKTNSHYLTIRDDPTESVFTKAVHTESGFVIVQDASVMKLSALGLLTNNPAVMNAQSVTQPALG